MGHLRAAVLRLAQDDKDPQSNLRRRECEYPVGAVSSPDSTPAPHTDGNKRASNLSKMPCTWLPTVNGIVGGDSPDSIPACLDLGEATPQVDESRGVVVPVNVRVAGVDR